MNIDELEKVLDTLPDGLPEAIMEGLEFARWMLTGATESGYSPGVWDARHACAEKALKILGMDKTPGSPVWGKVKP